MVVAVLLIISKDDCTQVSSIHLGPNKYLPEPKTYKCLLDSDKFVCIALEKKPHCLTPTGYYIHLGQNMTYHLSPKLKSSCRLSWIP